MSQFFPGPGPLQDEFESTREQITALNDKITNLIKKYTANVTVTAAGEINLLNVIPSDRLPIFVQGSTGRLTNGTGANEYAPYIFGDPNTGETKTITVYTVPR